MRIFHSGVPAYSGTDGRKILFRNGRGGCVIDDRDNKYVDFVLGYGPVILGHSRDDFGQLLKGFLDSGIHLPGYTLFHQEYLDRLLIEFPPDTGACFFKTSSEAVTAALRIAAYRTGKFGVVRCGFIGWHDAQLCKTVRWHEPPFSDARQELRFVSGMRGCGGNEEVFNWTTVEVEELDKLLREFYHLIGVLVFDAYQLTWSNAHELRKAFELCRSKGILVVFDETKTAGRIATSVALKEGLPVDMLILGKALANGAALSLLIGPSEIIRYTEDTRVSGTFSKELLGVYSGIATLELMQRYNGYSTLGNIGSEIVSTFNAASSDANVKELVSATALFGGGMFELRFTPKIEMKHAYRRLLTNYLADHGVLLLQGHPSFVCLSHEAIEMHDLYDRFFRAMRSWAKANPDI